MATWACPSASKRRQTSKKTFAHGATQRIATLGPVDGDDGDAVVHFV